MTPNNETYKTFQSLILASEGKTLEDELGFGCRVLIQAKIHNGRNKSDSTIPKIRYVTGLYEKSFWEKSKCTDVWLASGCSSKRYKRADFEILGQDITLERILRALERNALFDYHKPKTTTLNDTEDDILKYFVNYRGDLWHEGMGWIAKWELCKPAHLQEEETLLKLIEILS